MKKEKIRISLILQVAILFTIGTILIGIFTYFSQRDLSNQHVTRQIESVASQMSEEVTTSVKEYPSYRWLVQYWYDHANDMDIEYDVTYETGAKTQAKTALLQKHQPNLLLKYATTEQIEALSAEDQKLYAEITYSWLITRINQIKQSYHVDYLFCVLTKEPYDQQFFLISGANEDSIRGTNYEEVYPLGVTVTVASSQQEAMKHAMVNNTHLADAGDYVDYYSYVDTIHNHALLVGMTFNLTGIHETIDSQTALESTMAMAYLAGLALVFLLMIFYFVLRPLKKVQENIRLYKETKDGTKIANNLAKVQPRNEIGQLSEDVIGLTKEMDDYMDRIALITAEKERMGTELMLASRIQADMLPTDFPAFPNRHEFDLYATMDPAKEVGGDFYDFFLIDSDHLALVMADVSGKGIPASLFMMASKIIISNNAMMGKTPSEVLMDTNSAICSSNREEMFVTVWLGILEISTGELIASNAGHEYPIIKKPNGDYEVLKDKHGFVVGGMNDNVYKDYELILEPGSKLFLYTDGLPEATNANEEMFGIERILETLNKNQESNPTDTLQQMQLAVTDFVKEAEQFDDLTMMSVVYNGPNQS